MKKYLFSGNDLGVQCSAVQNYLILCLSWGCYVKIATNKSTRGRAEEIYAKKRINFQL